MSSTNKTTYYELPQYTENDIFNPLADDNDAYEKIDTALHNIADAEADDAAEIVSVKGRLDGAESDIDALKAQNGSAVLTTDAQTLSGAVNELKSGEDSLDGRLDIVEDDINNESTGLKVKLAAETSARETADTALSNEIEKLKVESKVIFMPVSKTTPISYPSGDCTVFITNHGKVIMLDTGSEYSLTEVEAELTANNIEHIDYFILSHYHGDHYGNIDALISAGYIDAETVSYLPIVPSPTPPNMGDAAAVRASLAITTIITISSELPLVVDGMKFDFFNADPTDYSYYQSIGADYNEYSACCYVEYKGTTILMAGDLQSDGLAHVLAAGYIKKCDILKMPHHAIPSGNVDFSRIAHPEYSIASISYDYTNNLLNLYNQIVLANIFNSTVYSCGYGKVVVGLSDAQYCVISDSKAIYSNYDQYINIYVGNNDNDDIGDGSEANPFADFRTALSYLRSIKHCDHAIINIVGEYTYANAVHIHNYPFTLEINGVRESNVNKATFTSQFVIENSAVILKNLNFVYTGTSIGLTIAKSKVEANYLAFSGEQKTGDGWSERCVSVNMSELVINNTSFNDKGVMFYLTDGTVIGSGLSGANNTCLAFGNGKLIFSSSTSYKTLFERDSFDVGGLDISYNKARHFVSLGRTQLTKNYHSGVSTETFDFSPSYFAGTVITVLAANGDEFRVCRKGSSFSTIQQTVVGSMGTQTCNVTTDDTTMTLSVEYNDTIWVFVDM